MKLLWHSLTGLEKQSPSYKENLKNHLNSVSRNETEIEFMGSPRGDGVNYRSFKLLDEAEVARNLLKLRNRDDIDGVAVGNSYDVAVREAREILDVPVLGFTETAILSSYPLAEKFAIVAGTDKFAPIFRDNIRMYGLEKRISGVYSPPPDVSLGTILDAFDDDNLRDDIMHEVDKLVKRAVDDGAEIILPGGGAAPTLINHMENISELHGVPVMDSAAVLLRMTETFADLYHIGAVSTSKKCLYRPPPDGFLSELESKYEL